jgi:hypothetical protein
MFMECNDATFSPYVLEEYLATLEKNNLFFVFLDYFDVLI